MSAKDVLTPSNGLESAPILRLNFSNSALAFQRQLHGSSGGNGGMLDFAMQLLSCASHVVFPSQGYHLVFIDCLMGIQGVAAQLIKISTPVRQSAQYLVAESKARVEICLIGRVGSCRQLCSRRGR